MTKSQRLLLATTLAAMTIVIGCNRHDDKPKAVDPAALARANAQIAQPGWLRERLPERLPEHTVAYARIP